MRKDSGNEDSSLLFDRKTKLLSNKGQRHILNIQNL